MVVVLLLLLTSHALPACSFPALALPFLWLPLFCQQVWQWVRYGATLDGATRCTAELVRQVIEEECQAIRHELGSSEAYAAGEYLDAAFLTKLMCIGRELHDFLTLPAQVRRYRECEWERGAAVLERWQISSRGAWVEGL